MTTMTTGSTDPPPRGRLFQETLRRRPFWMLLACQLVNLTTWEQARPVHRWIMSHFMIVDLADAEPDMLHEVLRPLGLWRRRAIIIPRFASAWLHGRPRTYDDVLRLPGCGKYAADSWAIFVTGRSDVEPNDGKLNWYLDRMRRQ